MKYVIKKYGGKSGMLSAAALLLAPLTITPLAIASPVMAQDMSAFHTGPVFQNFGPHAAVEGLKEFPDNTAFAIAFDVAKAAEEGQHNRNMESAARFINMQVAAGIDLDDIRIVMVVHGKASLDLLSDEAWAKRNGGTGVNPSSAMIREMMQKGVRFIICGQSAASNGIARGDLETGVETALSAMTAHALLQQEGYTLNPF